VSCAVVQRRTLRSFATHIITKVLILSLRRNRVLASNITKHTLTGDFKSVFDVRLFFLPAHMYICMINFMACSENPVRPMLYKIN